MKKEDAGTSKPITIQYKLTPPRHERKCQGCTVCSCQSGSCKSQPDVPLRLTGEILLKISAGHYTQEQIDSAWDVVKSLLNQHFSTKGGSNG